MKGTRDTKLLDNNIHLTSPAPECTKALYFNNITVYLLQVIRVLTSMFRSQ